MIMAQCEDENCINCEMEIKWDCKKEDWLDLKIKNKEIEITISLSDENIQCLYSDASFMPYYSVDEYLGLIDETQYY